MTVAFVAAPAVLHAYADDPRASATPQDRNLANLSDAADRMPRESLLQSSPGPFMPGLPGAALAGHDARGALRLAQTDGSATDADPVPRGGSFIDNFWSGVAPSTQSTPLGEYDYQIRADGTMRVNLPVGFLDMMPDAPGPLAGLELGPDGRVVLLDEFASVIGSLPIDPPIPGSSINITADGALIIVGPNGQVLWEAARGVVLAQSNAVIPVDGGVPGSLSETLRQKLGSGASSQPTAGLLAETFTTVTLTTLWRQAEGECLSANRTAGAAEGAAHMAPCAPAAGSDQVWQIHPASPNAGTVRIVSPGDGTPLCLTANLGGDGALFGGGIYVDACIEDDMQIWARAPFPGQAHGVTLKVPALGEEICLEGNSVSPDSRLGGASLLDSCQNVSGQIWIIGEITP